MKTTVHANGFFYVVSDEQLQKGDVFLLNNPDPTSSLKNVVRTCAFVRGNGTIQPINSCGKEYPASMCCKILMTDDPQVKGKPTILIEMRGGGVENIISTADMDIILVDIDDCMEGSSLSFSPSKPDSIVADYELDDYIKLFAEKFAGK